MKVYVKFLSQKNKKSKKLKFSLSMLLLLLFLFLMSQASYNLVTSVPMLIPWSGTVSTDLRPRSIGFLCYCTRTSRWSSDDTLCSRRHINFNAHARILADDAPFTSNAIEWSDCVCWPSYWLAIAECWWSGWLTEGKHSKYRLTLPETEVFREETFAFV